MIDEIPSVLIVDDDQAICNLVGEALAEEGYVYEIALTAHDALDKIRNHNFDVALLDVRLPDQSGIDLLEVSQSFFQTTSTIMMTAVKDLETAIQAMKLGASDYIVKPFTIDKLKASIDTTLENRKKNRSISSVIQVTVNNSNRTKTANRSLNAINAIAYGVDAQVDYFDFHSTIVTQKTIDFARQLCLPEKEINNWAIARKGFFSERNRYIEFALSKLERNSIAQIILGLTHSLNGFLKLNRDRN